MTDETDTIDAPETGTALAPAQAPDTAGAIGGAGSNAPYWVGAAVGIGSAAIVAALLYTKRKK